MLDTIDINTIICFAAASREQNTAQNTLQTLQKDPKEFPLGVLNAMTGNYSGTN